MKKKIIPHYDMKRKIDPAPGVNKSWASKFCAVAPYIFSISIAVLFPFCKKMSQFTCIKQKAPCNRQVHRSLQNLGPQYETYFMSLFLHVKFGSCS
jgi:hypothetical protein